MPYLCMCTLLNLSDDAGERTADVAVREDVMSHMRNRHKTHNTRDVMCMHVCWYVVAMGQVRRVYVHAQAAPAELAADCGCVARP